MGNRESSYILAMYDVSGIQDYIFATNRLRENAGASYQVTRILDEFLVDALQETANQEPENQKKAEIVTNWKDEDMLKLPEQENIRAEIIYIGGGNAVVLFRDKEFFKKAGEILGIRTAENCQGLYLAAAYIETGLYNFADDMLKLKKNMHDLKQNMVRQPIYSPFPVIEQEDSSHQPITNQICYGGKPENVTRIQYQKRKAYDDIKYNQTLFPKLIGQNDYGYPEEMDQLCREDGEDSSIAIVHIDGNGMGDRIEKLIEKYSKYTDGVPKIRRESKDIAKLFQDTYAEVLQKLCDCGVVISGCGQSDKKEIKRMFPLRPILLEGDDFTFLCRAELALPIAAGFMQNLMQKQKDEPQKITACGGIALVHSHFPFRLAYSIAEELCSNAKEAWYAYKKRNDAGISTCYLDFQVIQESVTELSARNRIWKKRPYSITMNEHDEMEDSLLKLFKIIKNMTEKWPSGRLHKIYRALLSGGSAMKLLEREFASRGYKIDDLVQGKWQDSPLPDALELRGLCRMDLLEDFLKIQ